MANEKQIIKLEKEIISKILAIKNKKMTPQESGIGKMINLMKSFDEPLHTELMDKYKKIISEL